MAATDHGARGKELPRQVGVRRLTAAGIAAAILLFGLAAAFYSIRSAAAGHGTYLPAKLLFPVAMVSTLATGSLSSLGVLLAVLQYPVYAVSLATAFLRQRTIAVARIVVAVHVALAALSLLVRQSGGFTP